MNQSPRYSYLKAAIADTGGRSLSAAQRHASLAGLIQATCYSHLVAVSEIVALSEQVLDPRARDHSEFLEL